MRGIVGFVIGTYALLYAAVNLPASRDLLTRTVARTLSEHVGAKVAIGDVEVGLFNRVTLRDVSLTDPHGRPLLSGRLISAKIALAPLFEGKISLHTIALLDLDDSSVATWAKESLWRPEGNLPDAAGDDVFGTVYYVDDVTWELLLGEAGAEKDAQGCVVVNEVLDSGHEGQQPFGDALLGTRLSLSGTEVSWEVVGLLDEVPGWFWLSRGELESVLPTVLAPASSVAGADREDIGYGMTTLYATADDSSAAAADVDRLLEENPALATWDGVVDERAEAHRSEALYGAIRALLSTFGVASAFNSSAASVLLRAHDFAVLRSVGMGERDLRRMPALECARTAAWGLALGLASARPCSDLGSLQGPQESPQQSTFSVSAGSTRAGSYRSLLEDLTTNPNPLGACRLNVGSSGRQVSARR